MNDDSEAKALADILDDIQDEGTYFGLPSRPMMPPVSVESIKKGILAVYEKSKAAKKGEECSCPSCGKVFKKTSYQQAFCSNKGRNNCKDAFWNRINTDRAARAKEFSRRY